jgi:hypothetical protein
MEMKEWIGAPHFTTTALSPIDDWLDEEIVGFKPEEGLLWNYYCLILR